MREAALELHLSRLHGLNAKCPLIYLQILHGHDSCSYVPSDSVSESAIVGILTDPGTKSITQDAPVASWRESEAAVRIEDA